MRHRSLGSALLLLLLAAVACSPDEAALQETVVVQAGQVAAATLMAMPEPTDQPTLTPLPTYTGQATLTPASTLTAAPTLTARPSYTPRPTLTSFPTFTPTKTPSPSPTSPPVPTAPRVDVRTALRDHITMTRYRMEQYKSLIPPIVTTDGFGRMIVREYADCPVLIAAYEAAIAPFPYDASTAEVEVRQAYQQYRLALDHFTPKHGEFVDACRAALTTGDQVTTTAVKHSELVTIYREAQDMLHQALALLE